VATVKIRLTDNDIRLRLNEFEVASVLEGRPVETTVSKDLVVTLVPGGLSDSSLTTEEGKHTVKIPARQTTTPSMIEPLIYESPAGEVPYILVEMDRPR
jgi:hypothetical protein